MIDAGATLLTRAALPWLLVAATIAIGATGVTGLYAGAAIEHGRNAKRELALSDANARAYEGQVVALKIATKRGDEVVEKFATRLDGMKVVNTTYHAATVREVEKTVYTDCKVPQSGVDLLNQQVDEVNFRLLGTSKTATEKKP